MADIAKRDANRVTTLLGVSDVDFITPTTVAVDPVTHALVVEATISTAGLATADNQTDGSQKTQIVDAGGEAATVTGGKLDVNASVDTTGLATEAGQTTGNTSLGTIAGAVSGTEMQVDVLTMPSVAVTNAGLTALNGAISGTEVQVDVLTLPAVTGTVTANAGTNLNTSLLALESGGNLEAIAASSSVLDDWDESDRAKVNPIVGQAGVQGGSGAVSATTQRVVLATDVALPTGSNAIGKLAANSGVDIGDVDVTSLPTLANVTTVATVSALGIGTTGPQKAEDVASAGGDMGVAIMASRLDTPVANAGVSNDGDYTTPILDNFRKLWVSGSAPEDVAHVAGEAVTTGGERRIDTAATSAGSSGDWATANQSAEGASWSTLTPTTTSGLSIANFTSGDTYTALTNSAQVIKASAGNLYGYYIYNPNATATYVFVYNIAAASVTVGTSTALLVFCIPATGGANLMFPYPISFSNAGWSAAAATTGGGNTAPSTALEAMFWYK